MTCVHGVCLPTDPALMPPASDLAPFGLVRFVYTPSEACHAAIRDYQTAGLTVAVVLARESFGADYPANLASVCDELARHSTPDLVVVGNEMDAWALGAESVASWTLTPTEYGELWGICEETISHRLFGAKLVVGGLVSGQPGLAPEYVRAVKKVGGHPSAVDVHPYARDAESASGLLYAYRALLSIPYVVLEWHQDAAAIPSFVRMLERRGIEYAAYFSLHQFDVPGLLDEQGNPTERYQSYVQALSGPQAPMEVVMSAIDDRANGNDIKDKLGPALGAEIDLGQGVRLKAFNNAVLLEVGSAGVYCLPESTVLGSFLPNPEG